MFLLISTMLRDKRWSLVGWSAGVFIMTLFTIGFFPSISQSGGLENLTDTVPEQLQGLVGDSLSFTRFENYVGQQVFNFRLPIILLIFAVIFTVGLTVSEEEKGTLKTLQALPVSRPTVAVSKWLVILLGTLVLSAVAGLSVMVSALSIGEKAPLWQVAQASFSMWLLVMSVASLVFLLAMATGRKGLTTGLSSLFLAATIIIPTVTIATPDLEPLARTSLYYYFIEPKVYLESPDALHLLLFASVIIIAAAAGTWLYNRRDIAA